MVIIVGAGLSGLVTAYFLEKAEIPFKILEASNRIGGRINTIYRPDEAAVEMGATWFNSEHKNLINLLKDLKIESFEQFTDAKVYYQQFANSPAQVVDIPKSAPSYRVSGGTSSLIRKLSDNLKPNSILLNSTVQKIKITENSVEITADKIFMADQIVLSIPPKLWVNRIRFEPELPYDLSDVARKTQTWMENAIKVALNFESQFWKLRGIPATIFSNSGPVTEFYDHSNSDNSRFALCGFINSAFNQYSPELRKELVLSQLTSIFGNQINEFSNYKECVWSDEKFTFEKSLNTLLPHQNNGHPAYQNLVFNNKIIISGSETSSAYAGYMEGAVLAGMAAATKIIEAKQN